MVGVSNNRRCLGFALLALVLLAATAGHAEDRRGAANALYKEGNALYAGGKYQQALDRYRRARALFPSFKLDLNIATSLYKLGWYSEAAPEFERFLAQAKRAPAKVVKATRARLAEIRKKVASVQIVCAVDGATLQVDGRDMGRTPRAGRVYLMPGIHRVSATRDGYRPFNWQAGLQAGQHVEVKIQLVARAKPPAPAPPAKPSPAPAPAPGPAVKDAPRPAPAPAADGGTDRPRGRLWTWVAAGCAVAALVVGIGLGASAYSEAADHNDLNPATEPYEPAAEVTDRLQGRALGANILFGAAGVFAATAVVLFFVEGRAARKGTRSAGVRLVPLLGQAQGLGLSASF